MSDCLQYNDLQHLLANVMRLTITPIHNEIGEFIRFPLWSDALTGWTVKCREYLYVRPCYKERLKMIRYLLGMGSAESPQEQRTKNFNMVAIVGSPGIGKSYFLIYLIAFFLCDLNSRRFNPAAVAYYNREIVYSSGPSVYYSFNPVTGVHTDNKETVTRYLSRPSTWFILNCVDETIPSASCRVILTSSPMRIKLNKYFPRRSLRKFSLIRWMPIWSFAEVHAAAKRLYPHLPTNNPNEDHFAVGTTRCYKRYELYGGIPMIIFSAELDETLEERELSELKDCKASDIVDCISINNIEMTTAERFVYYSVSPTYANTDKTKSFTDEEIFKPDYLMEETVELKWINPRIKKLIWEKLQLTRVSEIAQFLMDTQDFPALNSFRGDLLEPKAMETIAAGGNFRVRFLGKGKHNYADKAARLRQLPTRRAFASHFEPQNIQEIERQILLPENVISPEEEKAFSVSQWNCPQSPNHSVTDAEVLANKLFQITTSNHHPIKEGALHSIFIIENHVRSRGIPAHDWFHRVPIIFFCVPDDVYDTFDNTQAEKQECPNELFRFVLHIPFKFAISKGTSHLIVADPIVNPNPVFPSPLRAPNPNPQNQNVDPLNPLPPPLNLPLPLPLVGPPTISQQIAHETRSTVSMTSRSQHLLTPSAHATRSHSGDNVSSTSPLPLPSLQSPQNPHGRRDLSDPEKSSKKKQKRR